MTQDEKERRAFGYLAEMLERSADGRREKCRSNPLDVVNLPVAQVLEHVARDLFAHPASEAAMAYARKFIEMYEEDIESLCSLQDQMLSYVDEIGAKYRPTSTDGLLTELVTLLENNSFVTGQE